MPSRTTTQIAKDNTAQDQKYPVLHAAIDLAADDQSKSLLHARLQTAINCNNLGELIMLYHETIPLIEYAMRSNNPEHYITDLYQDLFQEMEDELSSQSEDHRHQIIIVIPVADRPRQLTDCITSLLSQCDNYGYGGRTDNNFNKLALIVADDSVDTGSIKYNQELCAKTSERGLQTIYFGNKEQNNLIKSLPADKQEKLTNQIGHRENSRTTNKGPSVMRNLSYLFLNRNYADKPNSIFYFIDSDQLFTVDQHNDAAPGINYFYYLDKLFTDENIQIMTGKVVGDPPVSPAVMANTLLDDVISFFKRMLQLSPDEKCQFHRHKTIDTEEAAYHDMADLFGYKANNAPFEYSCQLPGEHSNHDCLMQFSHKLNQFFDGEHPTRYTHYQHINPVDSIQPARTVYTGNYAFKSKALLYFIPFSALRLRMAGPTLGRLLKSAIGNQFVSANLPMLHRRTLDDTGVAEFRAGISRNNDVVDISQEFNRQYFGDVMLFSIEKLAAAGFPSRTPDNREILTIVKETENKLNSTYKEKQSVILNKLDNLKKLIDLLDGDSMPGQKTDDINRNLDLFIISMKFNYGRDSDFFQSINKPAYKEKILQDIANAISQYDIDMKSWKAALAIH